ncbi:hypothetical protein HY522_10475 [bacterium]|nr:hypothetical protein [bacterium]
MRRVLCLALLVLAGAPVQASKDFAPVPVVAILYFDNATGDDRMDWLPKGLVDLLVRDFEKTDRFKVLPRDKIEEVTRLYPPATEKKYIAQRNMRIGKLTGATHVITGRITRQDTALVIESRVFLAKDGSMRGWRQVEGSVDDLMFLQKELALKVIELVGAGLTDHEVIAMMQLPTTDVKAFAYYAMGLDANDHGDRDQARQYFQTAIDQDPHFKPALAAISKMAFVLAGRAVMRAPVEETRAMGASSVDSVSDLLELARANAFDFSIGDPDVTEIASDSARVNVKIPLNISVRPDYFNFWLYAVRRLGQAAPEGAEQFKLAFDRSDLFDKPVSLTLPASVADPWIDGWRRLSMRLVFTNPAGVVLFETRPQAILPLYIANTQGQVGPAEVTFWSIETAFNIEAVPRPYFDDPLEVSLEVDRPSP